MPMICSSVNRFFVAVPLWNGLYTVTVLNTGSRSLGWYARQFERVAAFFRYQVKHERVDRQDPMRLDVVLVPLVTRSTTRKIVNLRALRCHMSVLYMVCGTIESDLSARSVRAECAGDREVAPVTSATSRQLGFKILDGQQRMGDENSCKLNHLKQATCCFVSSSLTIACLKKSLQNSCARRQ